MNVHNKETYELVCVGFGPAALALAAAIEDSVRAGRLPAAFRDRVVFLEKNAETIWQGGLLLPGTNINHSAYRDLAAPRDPGSAFTFLRYLKESGRLYEHGAWSGAPSRIEWSDYVSWAARQLASYARYHHEVEGVERTRLADGRAFCTSTARGSFFSRQVMIACGMERYLPEEFQQAPDHLVRHADSYLYYRDDIDRRVRSHTAGPFRVAIVGSGLSAAEIMHDLLARHDPARIQVTSLHRGLAYRHYDMSQFSNQIYMPPEAARFSGASPAVRRKMFEKTYATNFAGVDAECSAALWNFLYERRIMGIGNGTIIDRHEILGASYAQDKVQLSLHDVMAGVDTVPLESELLILATGYRDTAPARLLSSFSGDMLREPDGELGIHPDYRLKTTSDIGGPIWLNGHCEHTHGIADTQSFSLVAYKAECLLESIFADWLEPHSVSDKKPAPSRVHIPA